MEIKAVQLFNDIDIFERKLMEVLRPVGSLYWTSKSPENGGDPNELFIGRWVRITDNYIYAADDTDIVDNTSTGIDEVKLTTSNLPKHTHGMNGHYHDFSISMRSTGEGGFGYHGYAGQSEYNGYDCGAWGCVESVVPARHSNPRSSFKMNTGRDSGKRDITIRHSHGHTFSVGAPNINDTSDGGFENEAFSIIPDHINRYCWERIE